MTENKNNSSDEENKKNKGDNHLLVAFLYGFISMLTIIKEEDSNLSFEFVLIMLSWLCLIGFVCSIQWFSGMMNAYFRIVMLMFFIARLSRVVDPDIAKQLMYIAIFYACGLLIRCLQQKDTWSVLFLVSIFLLEITAINFKTELTEMTDMTVDLNFISDTLLKN